MRPAPAAGALALAGYAPTLEATIRITVPTASLGITGYVPNLPKQIRAALASGLATMAASNAGA